MGNKSRKVLTTKENFHHLSQILTYDVPALLKEQAWKTVWTCNSISIQFMDDLFGLILLWQFSHNFILFIRNQLRNIIKHWKILVEGILLKLVSELSYYCLSNYSISIENLTSSKSISDKCNLLLLPCIKEWKNLVFLSPCANHAIPNFCFQYAFFNFIAFFNSASTLLNSALFSREGSNSNWSFFTLMTSFNVVRWIKILSNS